LKRQEFTVSQKITEIEFVLRVSGRISFSSLIEQCWSKDEIITLFFAALELIKQGAITARQDRAFGEIGLVATPDSGAELLALEAELAGVEPAVGV
jgi:chromatin segregation and condensation protein Rec8/ScpA/Scc1 (kleisin family)